MTRDGGLGKDNWPLVREQATASLFMTARPFEQTVDVETPELVVLTYSLAGVGSRVLAGLTDLAICVGAFIVFVIVMASFSARSVAISFDAGASWGAAVLILAQFVILWGYYVLFEGLMDGQTPGKRLHRLRVVRDGGYSVTFGVSAVRNLVRMLDMQPGILLPRGPDEPPLHAPRTPARRSRRGHHRRARGRASHRRAGRGRRDSSADETTALQTALSEDEYVVLARFVERWSSLEPLRRAALSAQLAARFAPRCPTTAGRRASACSSCTSASSARAHAAWRRAGETGAGRERQALIAAGMARWTAFAAKLAIAQKRGLQSLGEEGVREFVAEYRALSADLARLRTASAGRSLDEMFFLGRLVAGAHNLLYRDRAMSLRGAVRFLFTDVPREVRRSAAPIALAALLLFGPAVIAGGRRRALARPGGEAAAAGHAAARRGRRASRARRRGLHRRSAAAAPRDGEQHRDEQRAGDLRRVRRRRHRGTPHRPAPRAQRHLARQRRGALRQQGHRAAAARVRRAARRARAVRHLRRGRRSVSHRRGIAAAGPAIARPSARGELRGAPFGSSPRPPFCS